MEHDEHFYQKKKLLLKAFLLYYKNVRRLWVFFFTTFIMYKTKILTIYKIKNHTKHKNSLLICFYIFSKFFSADSFLCCCPNLVTQFSIVFIVTLFFRSTSIESG